MHTHVTALLYTHTHTKTHTQQGRERGEIDSYSNKLVHAIMCLGVLVSLKSIGHVREELILFSQVQRQTRGRIPSF